MIAKKHTVYTWSKKYYLQKCFYFQYERQWAHHNNVPGADELNVLHQVLPWQVAPHVNVEPLPIDHYLLDAGVQAKHDNDTGMLLYCDGGLDGLVSTTLH